MNADETPLASAPVSRRQVLAAAGTALTTVALAACRDDSPRATQQTEPIEPNGILVDVQSIDNTFRPDRITVAPGTEVRWTNMGRTEHDILPSDGTAWGVAPENFPPGATYSLVVGGAGEIHYYCSIHGTPEYGMVGTIVVGDELPSDATSG